MTKRKRIIHLISIIIRKTCEKEWISVIGSHTLKLKIKISGTWRTQKQRKNLLEEGDASIQRWYQHYQ